MKVKFSVSLLFGTLWLSISTYFALGWGAELSNYLNPIYVWWVIIGIALLPGFLMSMMFFSNLLNFRTKRYKNVTCPTTIIMCAYNEEGNIIKSICHICQQNYLGKIHLIIVDNCSTDNTKTFIEEAIQAYGRTDCTIQYTYCEKKGKSNALNWAFDMVKTDYFITVDADTYLEKNAVQVIMNKIAHEKGACVAGNIFVYNTKASLLSRMQNYDYLLSIAAIKRFQGSYQTTLVAQGSFSAYESKLVKEAGGWRDVVGEDIVLTYTLLKDGHKSLYEPQAVGYTVVPTTLGKLYAQRKRWAKGMLEGFNEVKPWQQKTGYSKFFTSINIGIIYLDLAYIFGFLVGVILAIFGYYYFVGVLTLFVLIISIINFSTMYLFQRKLRIPFTNSILGFLLFLLFYQTIQSFASVNGYLEILLRKKSKW